MTNPSPTGLSAGDYKRVAYHRHIMRTRTGFVLVAAATVALVAALIISRIDTDHSTRIICGIVAGVSFGLLIIGGVLALVGWFAVSAECTSMARFVTAAGGTRDDLVAVARINKNKRIDSYQSDADIVEYFARTTDFGPRLLAMLLDATLEVEALHKFDALRTSGTNCDPLRAPAVRTAMNSALGAVLDHIDDDYAHLYGIAVLADACGVPAGDFATTAR